MAILLDAKAREAIARRRAHGRDATLVLHIVPLRGFQQMVCVNWLGHRADVRRLVRGQVGDVTLYMSQRIARYVCWCDITVTAWRLGPLTQVGIVNEPLVMLLMQDWEQTHPSTNS